jgi:hypothetical protein
MQSVKNLRKNDQNIDFFQFGLHKNPPIIFFKAKNTEIKGNPTSYRFRKVIYVLINNLKHRSYSVKSTLPLPIISKFKLWSQV